MDNGPAGPAKTITRPRTYGDEKEKSGGPAGPIVPNKLKLAGKSARSEQRMRNK